MAVPQCYLVGVCRAVLGADDWSPLSAGFLSLACKNTNIIVGSYQLYIRSQQKFSFLTFCVGVDFPYHLCQS
jgi:hypothetical protein